MKKLTLLLAGFLCFCSPSLAQLSEIGIDPLKIESGSRSLGMGGIFAGLADDMHAAFYNPAGLGWVKGISLTVKDVENIAAIGAYPLGNNSALGLAVVSTKYANIPYQGGLANSNGNVVCLSYGTKLTPLAFITGKPIFQKLAAGVNIKGLLGETLRRTAIADRQATGWDMDLGLLWKGEDWWSAGISLQNILPAKIKWDVGGEEGIPAVAKFATSARVVGDIGTPIFMEGKELILGGELDLSSSRPLLLRLGSEWNIDRKYFFRVGFMQQYVGNASASDVTFGAGYRSGNWGVDFASLREPVKDERRFNFSFLYYPEDWIVLNNLNLGKPSVILEKPFESISIEDNIITYDNKIEISGEVRPGVEVNINFLRASVGVDNAFKVVVPLQMGKNLILVEARYFGEKKNWKYKVLRKARVEIAAETKPAPAQKEKVEELVTMGVIEIAPDAKFAVDTGITRAELATWLVKVAEIPLPPVKKDPFSDVAKDDLIAPYVKIVSDLGLLRPFPDGTFRPNAVVSKKEGEMIFKKLSTIASE